MRLQAQMKRIQPSPSGGTCELSRVRGASDHGAKRSQPVQKKVPLCCPIRPSTFYSPFMGRGPDFPLLGLPNPGSSSGSPPQTKQSTHVGARASLSGPPGAGPAQKNKRLSNIDGNIFLSSYPAWNFSAFWEPPTASYC